MEDDPIFKQRYNKYKLRVKMWEKNFKRKYGRIPSKYDIREASQDIRDSYKMYYKLKTSFLEDTLNDVLSEDGFDVLEMSQNESFHEEDNSQTKCNEGPQLPLDISIIVAPTAECFSNLKELPMPSAISNVVNLHEDHVIKNFEAVQETELNENTWGVNVSKKYSEQNTPSHSEKKPSNFKTCLNKKLFANSSSFSKRNPRKSLLRNNSQYNFAPNDISEVTSKREVLPDLETILTQKAKEQQAATAIAANALLTGEKTKESIKTQLDEGWLNRRTKQDETTNTYISAGANQKTEELNENANKRSRTYGLTNIDMSKIVSTTAVKTSSPNDDISEPIAANSKQQNIFYVKKDMAVSNDSDSVVSNSESECETQEYRHIAKRRRIVVVAESEQKLHKTLNREEIIAMGTSEDQTNATFSNTTSQNEITARNLSDTEDFSADDQDKDKDYEVEKKTKRKKIVAKRVKPVKKQESTLKERKPRQPKSSQKTKKNKPNGTKKEKKISAEDMEPDVTLEEQPLDVNDLKYTLALERGDITSVPRVKLSELDIADDVAQRYINNDIINAAAGPALKIGALGNEKRDAQRRKLEEKIVTGKLNENFVTINIQKKKFSRGKRSVNYSKYKKTQWKHKKRIAALTGPDMDMGGCDGGTLKCFTCGQAGHFAQQCKVKGDTLMPLTAQLAEDPSPFPTLEEAERMASQTAVAVHSRNINKLPQASNFAIYRQNMQNETDKTENESDAEYILENNKDDNDGDDYDDDGDDYDEDELRNIDLDYVTKAAAQNDNISKISPIKKYVGHKIPEEFLRNAGLSTADTAATAAQFGGVGALYDLNLDGSVKEVTPEVLEVLHMFGHTNFRKGQDRAIMRVLSGLSTLVTLSTGSGKSLCYQLPAYLYSRQKKSITLVISPLVSLMEDQVTGVPHFLRAHCLHTNQTPQQRLKIQKLISDGEIDILLVSPEAVVAGERSTGFGAILRQLPPIAFACIDEAHCVSQWSHNFRPSYLMICKVLKENLGVKTVLGLTATATLPTRRSIINHLGIPDGEQGIISDIPLPDNLILSISKDENKDNALLQLLYSKRFDVCQSIIIYCTRRDECERIAGFLRTCMQDRSVAAVGDGKKKRRRINWHAEPYHAGMASSRRRTIQNAFMKNELRIVVATIAFGMGINKPDIRAVIHYNMPRNFESYVQEIGRAGRDGNESHCHLFLDSRGGDQSELRRHIYANSIDRHVIRKLLQRIFVSCSCDQNIVAIQPKQGSGNNPVNSLNIDASDFESTQLKATEIVQKRICPGHEIGFSIEQTVEALDIPAENISTLLCYMELDARWCINVLSSAYIMAKVISYGGPKYLKHVAKECPPLAMAIALEIKKGAFKEDANIIEFSVVDIAAAIGWNSGVVKFQLKNLEWLQGVNGHAQRSPISVSFYDLGFRIKAPGDFTAEEIDEALDTLFHRSVKQEHTQLIQLQYVFQGLSSVAYNTYAPCTNEYFSHDRSDQLKGIIRDYFRNDYPKDLKLEIDNSSTPDEYIINDVHAMINMYPDNNFSGRNIARIFHGISSPNYPAVMWGRCKFWRAHSKIDFNHIIQLANCVIVKRRT